MSHPVPPTRGLYAIADYDVCLERGLEPTRVVEAMIGSGVPIVQLRAKHLSEQEYLSWIKSSLLIAQDRVMLVVNDRADLAYLTGAPAVHVGQEDLPVNAVRKVKPAFWIGQSTHNITQLEQALGSGANYLAFGPVFSTTSKTDPEPSTGIEALKQVSRLCKQHHMPLVAIGGITEHSLSEVSDYCDFVAAISLLLPPTEVSAPYEIVRERCARFNDQVMSGVHCV